MRKAGRPWGRCLLLPCLWAVIACTPLKPGPKAPEYARAVAAAPVWAPLESLSREDRQVLLNDGMEALDFRLRAIDSAVSSVDLQTFLWRFDAAGSAVAAHLLAAAERGVRVRILVDDTFLIGRDASQLAFADHPRIEYRVFNPYKQRGIDFTSSELLNLIELQRLDHRMHNKAMIVDGQLALVGGRNLANEYFGLHEQANFRDLELLVRGPVLSRLSESFDSYWNSPWSLPLEGVARDWIGDPDGQATAVSVHRELTQNDLAGGWKALFNSGSTGPARLVADRPPTANPADRDQAPVQVAEFLVDLFDSAEEEIVILSAYLIPTATLEGAVARAVRRGVSVRILTNSLRSNNHTTAHSAYRNHVHTLLGQGAELYEVRVDAETRPLYMLAPVSEKNLALHAKALLIDSDRVFVGSANLDPRSLRINTEMGLLVHSPALNAVMRKAFTRDFLADNAWRLELVEGSRLRWRAGDITLDAQPADSFMQRLEDWFFATLPLEEEL